MSPIHDQHGGGQHNGGGPHGGGPRGGDQRGGGACAREAEVLAARRPGARLPEAERRRLDAHLAGCESCRQAARVSSALMTLAAEGPGFDLPDPRRLYWRARLLERLVEDGDAAERAVRPVRWAWWAAGALLALVASLGLVEVTREVLWGLAGGAVVGLERVGSSLASVIAEMGLQVAPDVVQLVVWIGLALLAGASLLAAHSVLEEGR